MCKQLCVNLLAQGCQLSSFGYPIDHINVAVVVQEYRLLRHETDGREYDSEEIFEKPANFPISNISRDWNYHTSNTSTEISLSPKGISSLNKKKKKEKRRKESKLYTRLYYRDRGYIHLRFLLRCTSTEIFSITYGWNNVTWEFFLDSRGKKHRWEVARSFITRRTIAAIHRVYSNRWNR